MKSPPTRTKTGADPGESISEPGPSATPGPGAGWDDRPVAPGTPSDDDAVVDEDLVTRAGRMYLSRFAWIDGHADPWAPLRDPQTLTLIIDALAHLVVSLNPTVVLSIEARGFLYGPAVASRAGVGFTAVRKAQGPFPGSLIEAESPADYRGNRHRLRLRRDDLRPGDRVVLVDDWIETGSQAITAMRMAEQAGGRWAGCAVIVDQSTAQTRTAVGPVRSIVAASAHPAIGVCRNSADN